MQNGDIKWDLGRQDERHAKHQEKKIKRRIGDIYREWKKEFLSTPKTEQQVLDYLDILRQRMETVAVEIPEYREFTIDLINDCMARFHADQITRANVITQYLPQYAKAEPQTASFKTQVAFESIAFVKTYKDRPDFVGFVQNGNFVNAFFSTGECIVIGKITSSLGLDRYPTMGDLESQLGAAPDSGKAPAPIPGTGFPESPDGSPGEN